MRLREARKKARLSQQQVADYIGISQNTYSYWENEKYNVDSESLRKLSELFNTSVDYLLGKDFSIPKSKGVRIPVLGQVQAGIPIDAIEEILDYEEISEDMATSGDYFALQVRGRSMEPRMKEGDVVIIRQQPDVDNGDIAIVLVNGNDATIKKIGKSSEGIMLVPTNPAFEPIFYNNREIMELPVKILGKVVELRAKF